MTASATSTFWSDLTQDLDDPEFLREFIVESARIATIDRIVNSLDEARLAAGLTKAALARSIQAEPATIRRLFASDQPNPTLGTLTEVATALGLRMVLEPLPEEERALLSEPLVEGRVQDTSVLSRYLHELRTPAKRPA